MRSPTSNPLYVEVQHDYEPRLLEIMGKLSAYRVAEGIDWRARVEEWLSNFEGVRDQRLALAMLEELRVVSDADIVVGCRSLLAAILARVPEGGRVFHFAPETSGGALIRVLEKDLRIRHFSLLRQADFAKLGNLGRLRESDAVVLWDRFNGTGEQLGGLAKQYGDLFRKSGQMFGSLHFAYIAGHPPSDPLPDGASLHRWIEDVPTTSEEENDLCDRYAEAAGATNTNRNYETGALLTFADNPPNNVPLVLRAPGSGRWFGLLDRKETAKP